MNQHAGQLHLQRVSEYRPDIDGLRAVAVIAVLLYHYGATWLPGGFVGVDVFFVISGYLITGMLMRDDFNLGAFLARRLRRLLPALLVTIAATMAVATLLFSPVHLASLSRSAISAALGYSNTTFWLESGYFDAASHTKPLLHTWSLSVEWQFYALWCLLIVGALALRLRRAIPYLLAACLIASLLANILFQDGEVTFITGKLAAAIADGQATIFYNTPFRIFEFAIGAMIVWLPGRRRIPRWLADLAVVGGLAMIASAMLTFSGRTVFPSTNALLPTLGAALVLVGGQESRAAKSLLTFRPIVWVGIISYSLYLVHWPILVLYEYYQYRPVTLPESIALAAASLGLGYFLYRYVERPCRIRSNVERPWAAGAPVAFCAAIVAATASLGAVDGFAFRVDRDLLTLQAEPGTGKVDPSILGRIECEGPCEFGNLSAARKVLVVGDSHIDHYTRALEAAAGDRVHFYLAYGASCFAGKRLYSAPNATMGAACRKTRDQLTRWLAEVDFDAIILGQRWPGYRTILTDGGPPLELPDLHELYPLMFDEIASLYAGFDGPLVIVGHAPNTNTECNQRPRILPISCPEIPRWEHEQFREIASDFKARSSLDIRVVEPILRLCAKAECSIVNNNGRTLFTDAHHLSVFGAALIVPDILKAADLYASGTSMLSTK